MNMKTQMWAPLVQVCIRTPQLIWSLTWFPISRPKSTQWYRNLVTFILGRGSSWLKKTVRFSILQVLRRRIRATSPTASFAKTLSRRANLPPVSFAAIGFVRSVKPRIGLFRERKWTSRAKYSEAESAYYAIVDSCCVFRLQSNK